MNKELNSILKQIYAVMRKDRKSFVKWCLDWGHDKRDIAGAFDPPMTLDNLNKFISRYIKQDREGVK